MNKYSFLIIALCFFAVAAILENRLLTKHPETHLVSDFQEKLNENEQLLEYRMQQLKTGITEAGFDPNFARLFQENNLLSDHNGMGYLVYDTTELRYWSDRSISFYDKENADLLDEGLVQLPNGYYLVKNEEIGPFTIYGFHLIKHNYRFENEYLHNSFFRDYDLPEDYRILETERSSAIPVYDSNNEYLLSIQPAGNFLCTTKQLYIPAIIYFIGLIFLLFFFRLSFVESNSSFFLKLAGLGAALFIVYWLHILFNIPKVFYHLQFFSPQYFAINNWMPSLGDYVLCALLFLFWIFNFGKEMDISGIKVDSDLPQKAVIILLLMFSAVTYLITNYYFEELIYNSTISFSLNKIINISLQTGLGLFAVGLYLLSIFYFTVKVVDESRHDLSLSQLAGIVTGISVFIGAVQYIAVGKIDLEAYGLFIGASILASLFSKNYLQKFTLSYLIIFVSAATFYSLVVIYSNLAKKEREHQKLFAVTLVEDRDPAGEVFLAEIQDEINKDSVIPSLLLQDEAVAEYIVREYFNGYFRRYEVRVFVCSGADSLFIEMEDRMTPCYPFFDNMIDIQGDRIPGTNFYFMNNMNGRISYTGRLHYPHASEAQGISIFIELNSDPMFEGIGFPELLIDNTLTKPENYRKFSYAKYYGGERTDKHGDYGYNFYIDTYVSTDQEFEFVQWDGMEHLIYRTPDYNYVIVSRDLYTFLDYLISFPYLFVFFFLSVLIFLLIGNRSIRRQPLMFDLKFRIQAAIISIVFVSLLMVALATIWYNVREYKEKHQNDLNDKMQSIAEEIDMRVKDVPVITAELQDWLHRELLKLSNIFRTDINIYGNEGNLLASSRFEIFNRGLVSTRMNARAYYQIFENFEYSYFQPEKIGELSYLSAYKPILNNHGNYLGVINLPYFIKQDKYSQELSTIIVAFINLYVLLLLASIIAAVFIANQITRPLVVIQENLRKIQLGKRNEPIRYSRNDEIGSLVREYNKKVDELAVSAEMLARSERESAWREMAKQIAHEIKNPLTPMKLNIQQLQRQKALGQIDEKFMERVTSTLIEQIDNLSSIATEFSNFAKIPTARNQVFNLAGQLQKTIDLFETHTRVKIEFYPNGQDIIYVNADREQLSRAIINLIKNGIQAVPEETTGNIRIELNRRDHMARITVSDNGTGIPPELRDKLFSPSFTTKSSGMGLGLAIVKNIVENFSGTIWFETEMGKGTTFFIEIPVHEEKG